MRTYVHWLKINGTVSSREEAKQYWEIQNYLDRYPNSTATMYLYELHLFHRVVKLECNQDWSSLDLNANSGFHALRRLTRQPDNLIKPQSFKFPDYLQKALPPNSRYVWQFQATAIDDDEDEMEY
jgi:hypothetical protein